MTILHETRVHNHIIIMKNITFSARESLIRRAREIAANENTSLNQQFREWLERYASKQEPETEYYSIMKKIGYAEPGNKFSRNELNER